MKSIYTDNFSESSYWIDSANVTQATSIFLAPLPKKVDVVIVGGGLTGSAAAYEIAKAGRSVLVLDAKTPGQGASSRNAGMLGRNTKHSFLALKNTAGLAAAVSYFRELRQVFDYTRDFILSEKIECGYREGGRITVANDDAHFKSLVAEYDAREKYLGEPYKRIQHVPDELGSGRYAGGILVDDNVTIQPALYTRALIRRAQAAGAQYIGNTPVMSVFRNGERFDVQTPYETLSAGDVLIATNGYTGNLVPWLGRRMIQIDSYVVATEPLPADLIQSVMSNFRHGIDSTRRPNSFRVSPDGTRILFGGRSGEPLRRPLRSIARDIHADMVRVFPQLHDVRLSHAWGGRCGVTWDKFPHLGVHEGMHYALGLCFSGLATAPHLGRRAAAKILGATAFESCYAERSFPRVPYSARMLDCEAARQVIRIYGRIDHAGGRLAGQPLPQPS